MIEHVGVEQGNEGDDRRLGGRCGVPENRPVRLTYEQITGLLGATREATSKTLEEFATRGVIRQGRGRSTNQNPAAANNSVMTLWFRSKTR